MMRLILPYAIEDVDRKKPFTGEMEVAAIHCLAEAERKKGVLISQPEKISFVSKIYYPFWAIPWGGESLLVDGLEICSYRISLYNLPDIESFLEDIRRNSTSYKDFFVALKKHSKTFKALTPAPPIDTEAILDEEILLAFSDRIRRASPLKEEEIGPPFLSPSMDLQTAIEKTGSLTYNWRLVQSGIEALRHAQRVLEEGTKFHGQKILNEIELIKKKFEDEILALKPSVDKRIKQLAGERDKKIENVVRGAERKMDALLKRKRKMEDRLERLEEREELYRARGEASRRRKDKIAERLWKKRVERCRAEIEGTRDGIQEILKIMKFVNEKKNDSIKKINEDFLEAVAREEKKIASLNSSRDRKVSAMQNELEGLRRQSSAIIAQIKDLIDRMTRQAFKLKATVRLGGEEASLIYLPFYIVKYESRGKSRYQIHAPATAMGYGGIVKNIQRAILSFSLDSRIRLLLRPVSKAMKDMFALLEKRMHEDEALEKKMVEAAISSNLLLAQDFRDNLDRGLEELKNEGWIKQEEKDSILSAYDLELALPRVGEAP